MDRRTAEIYGGRADQWIAARATTPDGRRRIDAFAATLRANALVADLGCGPGWYGVRLARRGFRVVGMDFAAPMLAAARKSARGVRLVRGDLARLPFARESLDGAFARNTYMHLSARELPGAFAELHRVLRPGARVALSAANLDALRPSARERARGFVARRDGEERFRGRLFVGRDAQGWTDLLVGAGFDRIEVEPGHDAFWLWLSARRPAGLSDSVRPRLALLVCGLNPSPLAAATGVPFAGPNNRFWPAALRAGLVERERDLAHAARRGVGFTDLVKRPTPSANALSRDEYARGAERVARLVRSFEPRAIVFVGLDGVRRALDPGVGPGVLRGGFAGRPAYVMPSTSGRNAATSLEALVRHLRRARVLSRRG